MVPCFLAKKTGLARFVPIAYRAARRRRIWPDRHTLLTAYGSKLPFRVWKDGFLEAYVAEGTRMINKGAVELRCDPIWESRVFAACSHDVWRYIPQLQQPTLVIYGADSDTFLPPAVKRFKANVPSATFQRFEKTSHFVPMERPDETADAILTFLKDHQIL